MFRIGGSKVRQVVQKPQRKWLTDLHEIKFFFCDIRHSWTKPKGESRLRVIMPWIARWKFRISNITEHLQVVKKKISNPVIKWTFYREALTNSQWIDADMFREMKIKMRYHFFSSIWLAKKFQRVISTAHQYWKTGAILCLLRECGLLQSFCKSACCI